MGFFEKHKKTGYGVFYNIDNSGTKKPTHHPLFPAFTLRRRRQLSPSPQGFLLPASYLTNFWGLFLGKVAVALCGVFSFRQDGRVLGSSRPPPTVWQEQHRIIPN